MAQEEKKPRAKIDWEGVERDYRIGQLTIRQIQEKYKVSNGGMMARAKKEKWTRDLTEAVRLATKAKVRQKVTEQIKEQVEKSGAITGAAVEHSTFSEIDLAANANATIILRQQSRIGRLSNIFEQTTAEIESVNSDPEKLEDIARLIEEQDPKSAESIKRLKTVTTRLNNLKTAAEIMAKLTDAERTVFGLDEEKNDFAKKFGEGAAMGAADAYAKMLNG